ncbi:MAG: hypothetical protein ACKOYM_03915, partial [Actinomycetes bacterium]
SLANGEEETGPIWTAQLGFLGVVSGLKLGTSFPSDWENVANNYATGTTYASPSAATIQNALSLLPSIGPGNVIVTKPDPFKPRYDITFTGTLANADVPEIKLGRYLSVLPQEMLDKLLALAGSLGGGGDDSTESTTTTIPDGLTIEQYIERLKVEAGELILPGDFDTAGMKLSEALSLSFSSALANIDVNATIASINGLFPAKPKVETTTSGVEPIPEQFQDLCSQGSVTLIIPAAKPPTKPAVSTAPAPLVLPLVVKRSKARRYCYTTRRKVRVRIRGTKRYRRVTRKVRVCSTSRYAKRRALAQRAAARRAAARRAAARRAAERRAAERRR